MSTTNGKKRTTLVVALCALLCVAVVGGVFAWFNVTANKTNTFTVGNITKPEVKPDPIDPTKPDPSNPSTDGFITETKWIENSKITANSTIAKNPNVGAGKGSEPAYVFVEVENNLDKAGDSYFVLNTAQWAPVEGHTVSMPGVNNGYKSGLFVYTGGGSEAAKLAPTADADDYTGELFTQVVTNKTYDAAVNPTMDIKAYLAAMSSNSETTTFSDIQNAAITWTGTN